MLALRYEKNRLSLTQVSPPPSARGEALVRVLLSGICNTDLEIVRGYAGFEGTLGHEFVGVVEESAEAPELVGRRVVGEINAGCGICQLCVGGDARHCPRRTVLGIVGRDGAHAEFLRLPAINLLPVPDEIETERAVFAEPLAAACAIAECVEIAAGMRAVVIGDGKLGLLCAQALRVLTGAQVALVGKHRTKLEIAARRGVETFMLEEVPRMFARACDVVVEASGAAGGLALALDLVRPRGTLVLKSTFHGTTELNAARLVVDEIRLVGSRCGRFHPALELLREDRVDVASLVSEEFPLADAVRALERARTHGILKVLLRP